jgi:hypothetical protein
MLPPVFTFGGQNGNLRHAGPAFATKFLQGREAGIDRSM